jgi:hypothetical protein
MNDENFLTVFFAYALQAMIGFMVLAVVIGIPVMILLVAFS